MSVHKSELQGLKDAEAIIIERLNYLRITEAAASAGAEKFKLKKEIEADEKELDELKLKILNATSTQASKKILDNLIYISHHDEDVRIVETISLELQKMGYSPWMRKSLLQGEKEQLNRKKKLESAKLILFFLSQTNEKLRNSPLGEDIITAVELSKNKNGDEIFIIPIKLSACFVPKEFSKFNLLEFPSSLDLSSDTGKKYLVQTILDAVTTKFSLIDETGEFPIGNKFMRLLRAANRRYLDFTKGNDISGLDTNTIYLAGLYSYSIKYFDEAHSRFKKAKKFGYPEYIGIQSRIAGCLIKEGVKSKEESYFLTALGVLDNVLVNFPDHILALYNKAIALKRLKRIKESKETTLLILKNRPDFELARNNLAVILQEENDLQGAINVLSYLVERGKDSGITNYNLACFYSRIGKLELAFEHLLISFEFHIANVIFAISDQDLDAIKETNNYGVSFWDITRDMLNYYVKKAVNTANVLIMTGKFDEAQERLLEIFYFKQENARVNYTQARVYAKREEIDKAIQYLKIAVNESSSFIEIASHDPLFNQLKRINNGRLFWNVIGGKKLKPLPF